jgi:hypothetical protein
MYIIGQYTITHIYHARKYKCICPLFKNKIRE